MTTSAAAATDLVRQFPTDAASARALESALRAWAPAQVTLTGARYRAVLVQIDGRFLTYRGPVEAVRPTATSGSSPRDLTLHATAAADDLYVSRSEPSRREHPRPGTRAGGDAVDFTTPGWLLAEERRAYVELSSLWSPTESPHLAHLLCQASTWLTITADRYTRGAAISLEAVRLRRLLNELAVHGLDPASRAIGRRLADGWPGTTTQLLDTVNDLSART